MSKKANTNGNYLVVCQGSNTVWNSCGQRTREEAREVAKTVLQHDPDNRVVIFKAVSIIKKVDTPYLETEID